MKREVKLIARLILEVGQKVSYVVKDVYEFQKMLNELDKKWRRPTRMRWWR